MTNLSKIQKIAINFLYLDIEPSPFEIIVSHPFTTSILVSDGKTFYDLRNKKDNAKWRLSLSHKLKQASLEEILLMMNASYRLSFIKYVFDYLTREELSRFLKEYWTTIEAPSMDVNVSRQMLVKWFNLADKKILMDSKEYERYCSLPKSVKIYRGVTSYNKGIKDALSWTLDRKTAEWFADRFNTETGEVWEKIVDKDRILCYWESEDEVIVDLCSPDVKR